jgi:hypothetical protein
MLNVSIPFLRPRPGQQVMITQQADGQGRRAGRGQGKKRMLIPGGVIGGMPLRWGGLSMTISPSQTFDYKRML